VKKVRTRIRKGGGGGRVFCSRALQGEHFSASARSGKKEKAQIRRVGEKPKKDDKPADFQFIIFAVGRTEMQFDASPLRIDRET